MDGRDHSERQRAGEDACPSPRHLNFAETRVRTAVAPGKTTTLRADSPSTLASATESGEESEAHRFGVEALPRGSRPRCHGVGDVGPAPLDAGGLVERPVEEPSRAPAPTDVGPYLLSLPRAAADEHHGRPRQPRPPRRRSASPLQTFVRGPASRPPPLGGHDGRGRGGRAAAAVSTTAFSGRARFDVGARRRAAVRTACLLRLREGLIPPSRRRHAS